MSRLKHYTFSLGANYLLLGVTVAYSLISLPLALHFVSAEEYGIWVNVLLVGQLIQYLDLEMSAAFARIYIDYKTQSDRQVVDLYCRNGFLLAIIQAVIIWLVGWFGAGVLADLLKIKGAYANQFIILLRGYCFVIALAYAVRMFRQLLSANQRNDLTAYVEMTGLLLSLIVLGVGFYSGLGLWSLVIASLTGLVVTTFIHAWLCVKLEIMPAWRDGHWFDRIMFLEIWNYAKDRFLVSFGQRLTQLVPQLLITPLFGLQSATMWAAGIKVFNLLQQLVWKIMDLAYPALAEMLARRELERLKQRYRQLYQLSLSFSLIGGVFLLGINSIFIDIWLHGKVIWPAIYNIFLVVWLLVGSVSQITCDYIILTRNFGFFRWIAYVETVVAVTVIYMLSVWSPAVISIITGMVIASLLCTIPYALQYLARLQQIKVPIILKNWLLPVMLRGFPWLLLIAAIKWLIGIGGMGVYGHFALIVLTFILAACCALSESSVRDVMKIMWHRYRAKIIAKIPEIF